MLVFRGGNFPTENQNKSNNHQEGTHYISETPHQQTTKITQLKNKFSTVDTHTSILLNQESPPLTTGAPNRAFVLAAKAQVFDWQVGFQVPGSYIGPHFLLEMCHGVGSKPIHQHGTKLKKIKLESEMILLMAEIMHQLILGVGSLSHYLQGFIHHRWLAGFLPSTVVYSILYTDF